MRGVNSLMLLVSYLLITNVTVAKQADLVLPDIRQSGLVYCVNGTINTFNPQMARTGLTVDTLAPQLYGRLLDIDPHGDHLIPELAQSWQVLDKGATYILHLRTNVAFQHTKWFKPTRKMNADDVLFSITRMLYPQHPYHKVNGGHYPYFDSMELSETIKQISKLDDYRIKIELKQPDASFLWHLVTHYFPILSAEYANTLTQQGNQQQIDYLPVGTGPFMLSEYQAGHYIRLTRHADFWQGSPRMSQIVIDLSNSGIGHIAKLLTGECDILTYPITSQLNVLRHDPRLRLILRPGMNTAYLAFNTNNPPLNNPIVRRAIAYAINHQRVIQSIYYSTAETTSSLLPRSSWAYDSTISLPQYDPQKARSLLKEAGISELSLQLWVPTAPQIYNPSPLKTAELLQADMAQVGINVVIVPMEERVQETRLSQMSPDMTLSGWTTNSHDPDSFFRPLLSCAAINTKTNLTRWCNPVFDALLHQAIQYQKMSQRINAYHKVQDIFRDELPLLPLASSSHTQAYRFDIKGVVLNHFGNISFAEVYRDASTSFPFSPSNSQSQPVEE